MEHAYRQEHNIYWMSSDAASAANPNAFATLGVEIIGSSRYAYYIMADTNSFTVTAIANLDDDATKDAWKLNEKGELICLSNDAVN